MTTPRPTSPGLQPSPYWYTLEDCRKILGCSLRTVQRYLAHVPPAEKVMVTRRTDGVRTTRFWRVSPAGLRVMGHRSGLAPYL